MTMSKIISSLFILGFFFLFSFVPNHLAFATTFVSGNISSDSTWVLGNSPYVVQGFVTINPGVTLTIEPGVVIKFANFSQLIVNGVLNANGTPADKIYFTSLKDDSVAGDTNGDGDITSPSPEDWTHIQFNPGSNGNITNAVIRYAGKVWCSYECFGSSAGIYNNGGSITISNSKITNNSPYGIFNSTPNPINAQNNWWGSESGPFHSTLNPSGTGDRVSDNVNFIPWLEFDPTKPHPSLLNLGQFKSDGLTEISESAITTEDNVMFRVKVNSPANNQVKLQVEIKEFLQPFNGADILESDFVDSGSEVSVSRFGLVEGNYKWRARAVDDQGNKSQWQEFGAEGNVDFEVKLVPLYTQRESNYPSLAKTIEWSVLPYGTGNYNNCLDEFFGIPTIRSCGCSIASAIMMLRYHNITTGIDNNDVNPKYINTWLTSHNGYDGGGNLIWPQVISYSQGKIRFDGIIAYKDTFTLDNYLAMGNPTILYEASMGHFLVADGKLSTTYTIRDPNWFNTRYLTQVVTNSFTRNYNNDFSGLRLFSPVIGQNIVPDGIYVSIASPAEILITNSDGGKLGKDPTTGISYNEIPKGVYYQEGISAATDNPSAPHESKIIWMPNPSTGQYNLKVIGTGEGNYTLNSLIYDLQGESHSQIFTGSTQTNLITEYKINFTPDQPENINIEIADQIPPEAEIFFNPDTEQLEIKGIDNITVNPKVSIITDNKKQRVYQIQDEAGNTTKFLFEKEKQRGREIKAELAEIQYNNETIELPKTEIKYEWSLDSKTSQIKELEQNIKVKSQFKIEAKYNHKKDETKIKIKEENKKETEQTLSGLVIVKLITKLGILDFKF